MARIQKTPLQKAGSNWDVDHSELGGRISRRPKRRESTENAPGPKRKSAMVTQNENANWNGSRSTARNRMNACMRQEAIQLNGVNTPKQSAAATTRIPANSHVEIDIAESDITLRRSIPAAHRRKSNSPQPGPPPGNIENSLCTVQR